MNSPVKRRAGQPLVVFCVLLVGWAGIRLAVWESPFPLILPPALVFAPAEVPSTGTAQVAARNPRPGGPVKTADWSYQVNAAIAAPEAYIVGVTPVRPLPAASRSESPTEVLASHQLLWLAAMGHVPVSPEVAKVMRQRATIAAKGGAGQQTTVKRWSLDGWLFLRPDAALAANSGARFATYGASQAGAVLRYRLQPGSAFRQAVYARVSKALAAGRETEVAAGFSAVPLRGIPVAAHAELRATRGTFSTELRPAAFVVTEISPVPLPFGLRGETYLAAGYVGGDFATAFVDGQAKVDRDFLRFDSGSLRAGAGAWGGAQKGAGRLDVGPSASVNVQLGQVPVRLAVDYRLRAAGDAQPKSGVAITLTTGV